MKLSVTSALIVGAGLAQVGAIPLRVMVVTSKPDVTPMLRFGHAVPSPNNGTPAMLAKASGPAGLSGQRLNSGRLCRGARWHQKAVELSNTLRHALGFPMIEADSKPPESGPPDGMYRILPFVGTPPTLIKVKENERESIIPGGENIHFIPAPHPHHGAPQRHGRFRHMNRGPFMRRLRFALMALGPWEGRAVAFVLGCGIGVLIRMIWVLSVISYRMIKGTKEDESKYTEIIVVEEYDNAEDVAVPPPNYTYSDEKVKVVGADAATEQAK